MAEELKIPDVFKAYEEGKHRRYNLLFAVNGGAFAVAQLFFETADSAVLDREVLVHTFLGDLTARNTSLLGNLQLWQLSLGMALFTIVMILDIFIFGERMRKESEREKGPELFGRQGKLVLISIGLLIVTGWTLVSFGGSVLASIIIVYLGSVVIVYRLRKRIDYTSPEHTGEPHRGTISDEEKAYVRDHLDEVNARLRQQGLREINLSDPWMAKQYGLNPAASTG
jgi:membrane protein implicated in regulation of membrane protease activity